RFQCISDMRCVMLPPPAPCPALSPYTTLFRSQPLLRRKALGGLGQKLGREQRQAAAAERLGPEQRGVRRLEKLLGVLRVVRIDADRKSTRLNSSHVKISYAVFCLKKKLRKPWV